VAPLLAEGDAQWGWDLLGLLSIPLLIALNGLFVAAEFSLVALRKTQVEEMVRQGQKGAKAVERALTRLDRSIAATQLGITLASIALGWTGEPALARLVQPAFEFLPGGGTFAAHTVAWGLAFILITFMHVVFGEMIPKTVAVQNPDQTSLWLAKPLIVFARLTRPLTLLISGTSNAAVRLFGYQPVGGEEMVHSVEELLLLIEDTEEAGILEPEQAELVENVFRLSGKRVADVMVPRDKMAALELNTPPDKILEAVRHGAHTRLPVYEGNPDNIVGIVNTKDLFYLFSLHGVVVLHDALYQPLFLKPDESLGVALELFRRARRPMALVRNGEDKIVGVVTLEDILEEIVGDIEDEHDRPNPTLSTWRKRFRRRPGAAPAKPAPAAPKPAAAPAPAPLPPPAAPTRT
jgi:CBS domain containing-hemolysin-like protein